MNQRKAALFVDFDNIYLGLRQIDPEAAEEFSTNPGRWLGWLERYREGFELGADDTPVRRILLRKCYLNPRSFSRYRADFSRAAFQVVDCPPITRQGKTSTDIRMVMDILDTLNHVTHFDEFIILSADADFTPVLHRLRLHDRRTLIVSVGPASPAYRNAADTLISEDEFVTTALGGVIGGRGEAVTTTSVAEEALFDEMSEELARACVDEGDLAPAAIPRIYVRFQAFRESSDWLGHWSLRGLTEALVARRPEAMVIEDHGSHWSVIQSTPARSLDDDAIAQSPVLSNGELRGAILEVVGDLLALSPIPVPMPAAAQDVIARLGGVVAESEWAGSGSFKALISDTDDHGFHLAQLSPTRWVLIDPERHEIPEVAEQVGGEGPDIRLAHRISRTTGVPALSSDQYAALFNAISATMDETPYDLTETSKAVRDHLLDQGSPISRTSISFVLRGLALVGHPLEAGPRANTRRRLANSFRKQVATLCEDADLRLTEGEESLLDTWLFIGPGSGNGRS